MSISQSFEQSQKFRYTNLKRRCLGMQHCNQRHLDLYEGVCYKIATQSLNMSNSETVIDGLQLAYAYLSKGLPLIPEEVTIKWVNEWTIDLCMMIWYGAILEDCRSPLIDPIILAQTLTTAREVWQKEFPDLG